MTKEDRISFLKESCRTYEGQIKALKARVDAGERNAAGSMHDAELALQANRYELKQLTQSK